MFRRKRSFSHHQPLDAPSTQSAQSAASHAFLKSQPSSSSLSSAAAATALRSYSSSPAPVENVQTKRMLQRRASLSQTSLITARPGSRNGLRRSTSSTSMTSRTFRDQSLGRPATSSGPVGVPPVPSIPPEVAARRAGNRRSVSVDATMRPSATPPKSPSARAISEDREVRPSTGHSSIRSKGLTTVPEVERSASRASINFSYPMNAGANSPSPPPVSFNRELKTPSPLGERSPHTMPARSVSLSGGKPVTRRSVGLGPGEKNSFAGGKPGTAVAAAQAASLQKDDATLQNHNRAGPFRGSEASHQAPGPISTPSEFRFPPRHPTSPVRSPVRSSVRSPVRSPVRESYNAVGSTKTETPIESVDNMQIDGRLSNYDSAKFMEHTKNIHNLDPADPPTVTVMPIAEEPSPSQNRLGSPMSPRSETENRPSHVRQSVSPPRAARFSSHLSIMGTGEQLHQPPPRSLSPAKSALKYQHKDSLSPDGRTGTAGRLGQTLSELSDGTSVASDDGSKIGYRRKPAKVSFGDEAEIVGVAASPPTSPEDNTIPESPPGKSKFKTNWFGAGKKKSPQTESLGFDEFDDVLKPRPALPSFGSIRGNRDLERQTPVMEELSDNESTASSGSNEIVTSIPFSSDHALGGLLHATRPVAAHDPAESGDRAVAMSNTDEQRDTWDLKENLQAPGIVVGPSQADNVPVSNKEPEGLSNLEPNKQESSATEEPNSNVSAIAAQQSSSDVEGPKSSLELFRVPGGFPRASLEQLDRKFSSKKKIKRKPLEDGNSNTFPDEATNRKSTDNASDDDSSDSVYSDAAEDFDGDGFGSLNAIMSAGSFKPSESNGTVRQSTMTPGETNKDDRMMTPVKESVAQRSLVSDDLSRALDSAYPPVPNTNGTKRPVSVDAYRTRRLHHDGTNGTLPEQNGRGTFNSRQKHAQPRSKRHVSMDPGLSRKADIDGNREPRHAQAASIIIPRPTSNGSDSSSSFKRSSRSPKAGMQHSLRRTLRNNPGPNSPTDNPNSPGKHRPLSSGSTSGKMRTTLRTGDRGERSSFFSTGKVSKTQPSKPGVLFKSRFVDSDNEETGDGPKFMHSRFDDSSDDEEPAENSLPPVRGIPRRQGRYDGDSTELEDSSEDEKRPPSRPTTAQKPVPSTDNPGLSAVAKSRGTTREDLEGFLHQPPREHKPGLLSRLSKRKPKDPDNRVRRLSVASSIKESRQHEDPPHEPVQGNQVPNGYGQNITTVTSNNTEPSSQKPAKRGLKKYRMTESWSLNLSPRTTNSPEPNPDSMDSNRRSSWKKTKSGKSHRSILDNSHPSGPQVRDDLFTPPERQTSARDVGFAPAGRKKRFPALRRALGLRN
ncbi:hypothetical protein PHISCL_02579 [Aspergillus sclerotialis]|uniref:Uncharacterized protein n=1 Tax=Aspergillus sclerotialis TaxID=2070753 RepID=A0A3A2ZPJ7_9EURO|nr:hypothetical protein PHISCL_02579 [Aspergillus sclerotialis]